jgi:signal transduction histidine kinase
VKVGAVQVAATFAAAQFGGAQRASDRLPLDALAVGLLVFGPLALALRRRAPVLTLVGNLVPAALFLALNYRYGPAMLSLAVARVSAVVAGRRLVAWLTTGAGLVGYLGLSALLGRQAEPGPVAVVAIPAILALGLAGGELVRVAAVRRGEAERVRIAEGRRRVSEERLRIARDLHDVVAHHVSLVSVQANVALRALDRDPERARASVQAIKEVSRETMTDLRAVLAALRGNEDAPRGPAAGLDQLDELCARSVAAGLPVHTRVSGQTRPLSTAVDLAAFRIVQEAITNVRRHAGAVTATVHVDFAEDALDVVVHNDGPAAQFREGDGIAGMRERALTVGGTFQARSDGHGFVVRARLPYGSAA